MGSIELWHTWSARLNLLFKTLFFFLPFQDQLKILKVTSEEPRLVYWCTGTLHYVSCKTSTPSCSFRLLAFRFGELHPLRSCRRSDRTLQTGRRRDEQGRGPGLCTAAQKPRQARHGSHESPGEGRDAQHRSFNQSPQHLGVPRPQKGEYVTHAGGARAWPAEMPHCYPRGHQRPSHARRRGLRHLAELSLTEAEFN